MLCDAFFYIYAKGCVHAVVHDKAIFSFFVKCATIRTGDAMKMEYATISDIQFPICAYPQTLLDSLRRIGLNFPIHVRKTDHGYLCVDGIKRLNAIRDLLQEDPSFPKFQTICIIVVETARSTPPYHLHNHH